VTDNPPPQKIPLIFFRTRAHTEPVQEWLKKLAEAERHAIGNDLLRAQWRWPRSRSTLRLRQENADHAGSRLGLARKRRKELER